MRRGQRTRRASRGADPTRPAHDGENGRVSDFDPTGILSDDLLARIRDRAAVHDRENTFPERGPRRADGCRLPRRSWCRQNSAARGSGWPRHPSCSSGSPAPRRRRPSRSTCTSSGPASRRCSPTAASTTCASCRRAPRRARSSPSGSARRATTSCSSAATRMPHPSPTARTRSPARRSSPRSPRCGRSWACTGSTPPRPDAPQMVYAFVPRTEEAEGRIVTRDDWDTLGMRGTQSRTTELHGCDRAGRPGRAAHRPRAEPRSDRVRHLQRLRDPARLGVHRHRPARARPRRRDRGHAAVEEDRARPTARIPTSAGASPTWRSPTTRCRPSSRRSAGTSTTLADHGARWFSLLSGVKHRAVTMAKARRRRRDPGVGRLVVLLVERAQPPVPRRARGPVPSRPTPSRRTRPSRARGSDRSES